MEPEFYLLTMIVDDELRRIRTYIDELVFLGFEVITAGSADKALELLNSQSSDLFIFDIMRPVVRKNYDSTVTRPSPQACIRDEGH